MERCELKHVSFGISQRASDGFEENFQVYAMSKRTWFCYTFSAFSTILQKNNSQCTILNAHHLNMNMNLALLSKIQSHCVLYNFFRTADIWTCSTTAWRQGELNPKSLKQALQS